MLELVQCQVRKTTKKPTYSPTNAVARKTSGKGIKENTLQCYIDCTNITASSPVARALRSFPSSLSRASSLSRLGKAYGGGSQNYIKGKEYGSEYLNS